MIQARAKLSYTFGTFRLDATERVLFNERGPVSLTPKAFDTLLALVQHSGRVLTTEELISQVWPDSFVEGNNLAQNISTLRKVLDAGGAKFIETIPKRGYRFVAEVSEIREEPPTGERPPVSRIVQDPNIKNKHEDHDGTEPIAALQPFTRQVPAIIDLAPDDSLPSLSRPVSSPRFEFTLDRPPETMYARSGDVNIAYQVIGDAPIDLVFVMGWVSHLEYFWREPSFA